MPTHKTVRLEHRGGMRFARRARARATTSTSTTARRTRAQPGRDAPRGARGVLGDGRRLDREEAPGRRPLPDPGRAATSATSTRRSSPEIDVTHEVDGPDIVEAAIRRCIELSATKYCPVNAMLSAGATEVHHRYRLVDTGATPHEAEGEVVSTGPYARPDVID